MCTVDEEELTEQDLKDIKQAMKDFKAGRYITNKELKKELGL